MFTGIIEQTGIITAISASGTNKSFWIESQLWNELKVDQSVSHNGVCLTVEEIKDGMHRVTAIAETLSKTNVAAWQTGEIINLERCLVMNGRLDGHIVQGHTDTTAVCTTVAAKNGSWEYTFEFDSRFSGLIIEKGSIALNGISLTVFNVTDNSFAVAIIPYTYNYTNMQRLKKGDSVNIEWDIIGKYVNRLYLLK
jgi:riboflavin synthase